MCGGGVDMSEGMCVASAHCERGVGRGVGLMLRLGLWNGYGYRVLFMLLLWCLSGVIEGIIKREAEGGVGLVLGLGLLRVGL